MEKTSTFCGDVIIAGGGAAGISAVIWCADLGLRPILVERSSEIGGQLPWIHNRIANYPGVSCENGRELRDLFNNSLSRVDFTFVNNAEVVEVDVAAKAVTLLDGRQITADAMILATGIRRRTLGIGEEKFAGKGILESGVRDAKLAAGKRIAVIGGGDAAVENALLLSVYSEKVFLIHRRDELSARDEFTKLASVHPKIEMRKSAVVRALQGNDQLNGIEVENIAAKTTEHLAVDFVLFRIGVTPNTEMLRGQIELDDRGYIKVDSRCKTSMPGIYAAGDAANPMALTIAGAVGMGATAAKAVFSFCRDRKRI